MHTGNGGEASVMGQVQKTERRGLTPHAGALLGIALSAVLALACSSAPAKSAKATSAPSAAKAAPAAATAKGAPAAAPAAAPPVEITSIELREGAPGLRLDVTATGSLVWTSYRDSEGGLVVELPNAVPAASLAGLKPAEGLVASVDVQREQNADRPLTRLTVRGREQFEYNLSSDDKVLQLRLVPSGATQIATNAPAQAAPSPAVAAPAPAPTQAAVPPVPAATPSAPAVASAVVGTPDNPVRSAPPASGAKATRLDKVEVVATDGGTAIAVRGDGEFSYSTFRLENPERLVLDLDGVVNLAAQPTLQVGSTLVERVRVAQFKPRPEPIARVVFDLKQAAAPTIERDAKGLRIRFTSGLAAAPAPPTAAPAPTLAQDLSAPAPSPSPSPSAAEATAPAAVESAAPAPKPAPVPAQPPTEKTEVAETPPAPAASPVPAPTAAPPAASAAPSPVAGRKTGATSDVALFEAEEVKPEPVAEKQTVLAKSTPGGTLGGAKVYRGEPISLTLKDADIKDVLRSFAQISNLNIVVQPGVHATVTVELEGVPWDQALDEILKINNLGMELDGNILRIAPVAQLRAEAEEQQRLRAAQALSVPLQTVIKHLSYATAQEVAQILQRRGSAGVGGSLMSERGTVTIDQRTNTLIIKELPGFMDTVIAVIENLDTPEPQVMIEAKIVETTKKFTRTLGVSWGINSVVDPAHGNTTGLQFPNQGTGSGAVNLLTGAENGLLQFTLGNVTNSLKLNATLAAAETEGLINVLSAPKIATLNNERAEVQSGLQIPIQTVANNTVSVQFVNATLRLAVTPHVTAEGTVLMQIDVEKREPQLAFAVVGAQNAPIDTKEAHTRVIVRDGGTAVIGGIYQVSTDQGQDRVPGLANVPILGHLFKNHRRNDQNTELLIFITPRVIKL